MDASGARLDLVIPRIEDEMGVRHYLRTHELVRLGRVGRHPATHRCQLALRRLEKGVVHQPAKHVPRSRVRAAADRPQRNPQLVVDGKTKSLRHDANNRRLFEPEAKRAANDGWIRKESALPQRMTDDGHRWRGRGLVARHQRPSELRRHTRDPKSGRRDRGNFDRLDSAVDGEVALEQRHRAEVVHALKLLAPSVEICLACGHGTIVAHVPLAKADNASPLVQRQGRIEELPPDLKPADACRNAKRQAGTADDRQEGIPGEHAPRQPEVEREAAQPRPEVPPRHLLHIDCPIGISPARAVCHESPADPVPPIPSFVAPFALDLRCSH